MTSYVTISRSRLLLTRHRTFRMTGLNDYKDLFDKDCLSTRGCEGNEAFCHLSRNVERVLKGTRVFLGGFATSSDSPSRLIGARISYGLRCYRCRCLERCCPVWYSEGYRRHAFDLFSWVWGIPCHLGMIKVWTSQAWNWTGLCAWCSPTFFWNKSCPLSTEVIWVQISKPIQVPLVGWKKLWQRSVHKHDMERNTVGMLRYVRLDLGNHLPAPSSSK